MRRACVRFAPIVKIVSAAMDFAGVLILVNEIDVNECGERGLVRDDLSVRNVWFPTTAKEK
jgi:hypothetical protein